MKRIEVVLEKEEIEAGASINDKAQFWMLKAWKENIDKEWQKKLDEFGCPWIAILHDKDYKIDEETGEKVKIKPHFHIFINRKNGSAERKGMQKVKEMINGHCLLARHSKENIIRYFLHIGELDKFEYKKEKLIYNKAYFTEEQIDKMIREGDLTVKRNEFLSLQDYVMNNNITNYNILIKKLKKEKNNVLIDWVIGHNSQVTSMLIAQKGLNFSEDNVKQKEKNEKKEIIYTTEEPTFEEYRKEMAEEFGIIVEKPKQEEDIMAGFRELEEKDKKTNKKAKKTRK